MTGHKASRLYLCISIYLSIYLSIYVTKESLSPLSGHWSFRKEKKGPYCLTYAHGRAMLFRHPPPCRVLLLRLARTNVALAWKKGMCLTCFSQPRFPLPFVVRCGIGGQSRRDKDRTRLMTIKITHTHTHARTHARALLQPRWTVIVLSLFVSLLNV